MWGSPGKVLVKHVANTPQGFEQIQHWLHTLGTGPVHVVLEATGTYSDAVALYFVQRGERVSVINPARMAAFRKSEGIRTKTDKQDAKLVVRYGQQKQPPAWTPTAEELQQLQVLELRREQVQQMRQQEVNDLENSRLDAQTRQQITTHVEQRDAQIAEVEARTVALVKQHESLRAPVTCSTRFQACAAHRPASGRRPQRDQPFRERLPIGGVCQSGLSGRVIGDLGAWTRGHQEDGQCLGA